MSRLIAFGCSYTFGHGLEDCLSKNRKAPTKPSRYAWPKVLSTMMNLDCINLGIAGASNKHIWYKALTTEYQEGDIVVFLWSHIARWCKITDYDKVQNVGNWTGGKMGKCYYSFLQNDYDSNLDLNLRVDHISLYLDKLGIRSYHCYAVDRETSILDFNSAISLKTSFQDIRGKHGLAEDKKHPDKFAHIEFADSLYKEIKERTDEITIQ